MRNALTTLGVTAIGVVAIAGCASSSHKSTDGELRRGHDRLRRSPDGARRKGVNVSTTRRALTAGRADQALVQGPNPNQRRTNA